MPDISEQANGIVQGMMHRLLNKKMAQKEVVITESLSVKGYWCGEVLRFDIQKKGVNK